MFLSPLDEYPIHQAYTEADGSTCNGVGLFEHAVIGPHHPSGFHDWTDVLAGVTA